MSTRTAAADQALSDYLHENAKVGEPEILARLREETSGLEMAIMQISVEQGRLMSLLASTLGVRRAIEVGTFTGYSALCVALRMPADGELICCDVSEEWTSIARRYWAEAGVADRIHLKLAPATETLDALLAAGRAGEFDFAFIDADKEAYPVYYEKCVELVRSGGMIAIDNMFLRCRVLEPAADDAAAQKVRALTEAIFRDERVDPALVPIGDGLMLARKR